MMIDTEKTVRELVVQVPAAMRVFQKYGIDFCCGGEKSLTEACEAAGAAPEAVLRDIEAFQKLEAAYAAGARDWSTEPLTDLIAHINNTHHVYVRSELPRIEKLLAKVPEKHGGRHPELFTVRDLFTTLSAELTVHLMKEEQILFPYVERMEESAVSGEPAPPAMFGPVENPVRMMMYEHESAGDILRQLRRATDGYVAPEDACEGFQSLYKALADFESDLHQHIHLENNILFPRAIALSNSER